MYTEVMIKMEDNHMMTIGITAGVALAVILVLCLIFIVYHRMKIKKNKDR